MKYFIISGEASGDLHAANWVKEMKQNDPNAQFAGWGGDLMQDQGVDIKKHYKDLAFMGFVEVLMNLKTILNNFKLCKSQIKAYQPDAVLLVDYPGFNLRMAEWLHKEGFKVFYYIAPSVWAWKKNRIQTIKKYVTQLFVILPFEAPFFEKENYHVDYVGNPLLDAVKNHQLQNDSTEAKSVIAQATKPIITLMPGSRKQEIKSMLPVMLKATEQFPDYQFIIAGARSQPKSVYESFHLGNVKLVFNATYDLLQHSVAGLITSGTATLETAIFKVPQVVMYKANPISYTIAKNLVNIKYISLVNLILDRPAVTELIQGNMNVNTVIEELKAILPGGNRIDSIKESYQELHDILGNAGASKKVADLMWKTLNS
jgi:lipid-A-disaccharide synthase